MNITMVKKIMPDGSQCPKCQEVTQMLEDRGHLGKIGKIVEASPKDPKGEGMQLVKKFKMKRAPFFVVEKDDGSEAVYDVALKMVKEVLES